MPMYFRFSKNKWSDVENGVPHCFSLVQRIHISFLNTHCTKECTEYMHISDETLLQVGKKCS